jgi:hypothetical protein
MVDAWYMLVLVIGTGYLVHGAGCYRLLVQVEIGSGQFSDSDKFSTFGIYILGWLDGAWTGGCSYLLVVDEELRGL